MSNILIIGNGFDLSLRLNTSYKHFLESKEYNEIKTSDGLFQHLTNAKSVKNWIDVEVELKNYSRQLVESQSGHHEAFKPHYTKASNIQFKTQFRSLVSALREYLTRIIKESSIQCSSEIMSLISIFQYLDSFEVINFNYTNTFYNICSELKISYSKVNQINIHNTLSEDIIFGVEDINSKIPEDHFFIQKSTNESYGQNTSIINKFYENYSNFFFFGYSLGETDFNYFYNLFLKISKSQVSKAKSIIIFYYDEDPNDPNGQEAKDSINQNLTKMLKNGLSDFKLNCNFELVGTSKLKEDYTRFHWYLDNTN